VLPPRMRAVLVLRYYEDLSEADTAHELGCSVGAVKSQAHHAINRLRTAFGDPTATVLGSES
jgi:RNA polymerase sigma factor (sigma-70 family)